MTRQRYAYRGGVEVELIKFDPVLGKYRMRGVASRRVYLFSQADLARWEPVPEAEVKRLSDHGEATHGPK